MTGIDKLRREGYLGSGIRVAVLDSGVDYKHPALGGCFGKGCLVEFGYNFINNSEPPYDDCNGHGMNRESRRYWIFWLNHSRNSCLWTACCLAW